VSLSGVLDELVSLTLEFMVNFVSPFTIDLCIVVVIVIFRNAKKEKYLLC